MAALGARGEHLVPEAVAWTEQQQVLAGQIRRVDGQTGTITTFAGTGEAGFSGVISKPFRIDRLVAAVTEMAQLAK